MAQKRRNHGHLSMPRPKAGQWQQGPHHPQVCPSPITSLTQVGENSLQGVQERQSWNFSEGTFTLERKRTKQGKFTGFTP